MSVAKMMISVITNLLRAQVGVEIRISVGVGVGVRVTNTSNRVVAVWVRPRVPGSG